LPLVTTSNVNDWSFTSGYGLQSETTPADFAVSLTTGAWTVNAINPVTLSVSMGGIYYSPSDYVFNVEIRNHHTSVTVIGDHIPY